MTWHPEVSLSFWMKKYKLNIPHRQCWNCERPLVYRPFVNRDWVGIEADCWCGKQFGTATGRNGPKRGIPDVSSDEK